MYKLNPPFRADHVGSFLRHPSQTRRFIPPLAGIVSPFAAFVPKGHDMIE